MNYMEYQRGSEWRKWDLHIHTPETKKNDQFEGSGPEDKWQKFVKSINESAEDISVIGITDYFCIDNYFKFKSLVADGIITKTFDLVLPNIEIRVLPVTGSSTPINLHCIFNPAIDIDIANRFLAKLKFSYGGSDYSAKKEELIRLGKALPSNGAMDDNAALRAGVSQYVVSTDTLRTVFEKDQQLRDNTIIVVSNKSTDGASGIRKHEDFFVSTSISQLDATRWSIYQFSDALFSSNANDILYFLGLGPDSKEVVIEKCASLMPCFHGCDAHCNEKIFKPDGNRFCWIKADPTFDGLKQTIYEPGDRVRVQALKPDMKNDRFLISSLRFIDDGNLFGNQQILLNENLNAIIGGKSSGKSLLLYSTARSIDPDQVNKTSKRLNFEGYHFDADFNFEVVWKNGEKDFLLDNDVSNKLHKISYIPQLYINYLVEKNNKEELNTLIKNILLQDNSFKSFFETNHEKIASLTIDLEKLLSSYLQTRTKALAISQKSSELGKSDAILSSIKIIEEAIKAGQEASTLDKVAFDEYSRLVTAKSASENELRLWQQKDVVLQKILTEVINANEALLGNKDDVLGIDIKGELDRLLDEFTDKPHDVISIRNAIATDYDILIQNLVKNIADLKLQENINRIEVEIVAFSNELKPYLDKIEGQNELQKLTKSLETEKGKYQEALSLENQFKVLLADYENIRRQMVVQLERRYAIYKEITGHINATKKIIGPEISLDCRLIYKRENFQLFEQANKAAISSDHYLNTLFRDGIVNYDLIPTLFASPLKVAEDKLIISAGTTIPLKQKLTIESVLRGLIADAFELDYTVTYKGDDLLNMSPGKKGTVLLILFLQISSSEYPILIDQPEDNLDNRTIYDLLCKMIKQKKKERQIIIVSHNANLVVATDTENIIVANQEGQGTVLPQGSTRFTYVNGSLEHSYSADGSMADVLMRQGIKEHVCDILEGGDEAFKQRERKYALK